MSAMTSRNVDRQIKIDDTMLPCYSVPSKVGTSLTQATFNSVGET